MQQVVLLLKGEQRKVGYYKDSLSLGSEWRIGSQMNIELNEYRVLHFNHLLSHFHGGHFSEGITKSLSSLKAAELNDDEEENLALKIC